MADNPKRVLDTLRAHIQELMRRCNVLKREKEELEKRIEEQKSTIATLQRDLDEMSQISGFTDCKRAGSR